MQQKSPSRNTWTAQYLTIRYIRHAPVRLRIDANMFVLTCGYAAICLLMPLRFAWGVTRAGSGVRLSV